MNSAEDTQYRLRLARGFRDEARQDVGIQRWRSCVDNSQLAVENAAKAIAALAGPVARTDDLGSLLRQALQSQRFSESAVSQIERLAGIAVQLGWSVHMASDYGDEVARQSPWELFGAGDASHALELAETAVELAEQVVAAQPNR